MPLFVPFSSPTRAIDHRAKSEASEEKQELEWWRCADRAMPGAGHVQGCLDLALCVLSPLYDPWSQDTDCFFHPLNKLICLANNCKRI